MRSVSLLDKDEIIALGVEGVWVVSQESLDLVAAAETETCRDLHCAAAGDVNANDVIVTSEGLCVINYCLCVDMYVHVQ